MSERDWAGRRVLVTGASGIVGSRLVADLLDRRAHVVVLIRDADPQSELFRSGSIGRVTVVNGALEDFWALERAINEHETDTVFHLGAQTIVGTANRFPLPTFEANIRGSYNLLEACRLHAGIVQRIVIASSDKAYGDQPVLPYHEDMPLQGRHPYDVSKSCVDLIAQAYHTTYGLPVGITRFGNVYGGGDMNWSRIVPGTVRSLLHEERPIIRSDGQFIRDYIYVADVSQGYLRLAERLDDEAVRGQAFNFSTENPISVLGLVAIIQELMGRTDLPPDVRGTARGEIRDQYLSAAKSRSMLGWQPEIDLRQGLALTIEWYRAFFEKES